MRRTAVVLAFASFAIATLPARAHASPLPTVITIDGRGFGHGIGMSQYGARGLAVRGESWRQILLRYYRDVHFSAASRDARIRVLLDRTSTVVATSARPFRVNADHRTLFLTSARVPWVRIRAVRGSTLVERAGSSGGPWSDAGRPAGPVTFARARSPIAIDLPAGRRWFRGALESIPSRGSFVVVNDLPMDLYLRGVVPREMPASWPADALAAQTVAARTYAVRVARAARARGARWDICATTACQVYGGYGRRRADGRFLVLENPRVDRIIANTNRRVLTYAGRPILAQYASSSGGLTRDGDAPYLRAVPDPGDAGSPYHTWRVRISPRTIEAIWPSIGRVRGLRIVDRDGIGTWGGRVRALDLVGTRRTVRVSGSTFAARLDLRSTWFYPPGRSASAARYRFTRTLRSGMTAPDVAALQIRMRSGGLFPARHAITRYFGPLTLAAVRGYQRARHLPVTGVLDARTRATLNA